MLESAPRRAPDQPKSFHHGKSLRMPPPGQGIALGHHVQGVSEACQVHYAGREKRRTGSRVERAAACGDQQRQGAESLAREHRGRHQARRRQGCLRDHRSILRGQGPTWLAVLHRVRHRQLEPLGHQHQNHLQQKRWPTPQLRFARFHVLAQNRHRVSRARWQKPRGNRTGTHRRRT